MTDNTRGRKSRAELSVPKIAPTVQRPEPPPELSEAQAELWRSIVGSLPANWIRPEHHGILVAYCRAASMGDYLHEQIAQALADGSAADVDMLNKLTMMAERESRALIACARSLRLTPQSRWRPDTAARKADSPGRPWDIGG
jgi:phage terminase small subunit